MRVAAACLLAASALISGCGRHDSAQVSAGGAAQPTEAATPVLTSRPHPKAGLWRTSMSTNAGPGITMTGELCVDSSTEDSAFSANGRSISKDCEPTQFAPSDGGFAFTAVCHAKGRTITTKGLATGDFRTSYALDVSTQIDPSPAGLPPEMHTKMQATWLGPCKPGQKPGQASMRFGGFGQG
jgi:hypothetical protein